MWKKFRINILKAVFVNDTFGTFLYNDIRYNFLFCTLKAQQFTVLNPRYMTRISCRVNLVWRHKSSSATGIGLGTRVVSSS